MDLEQLMPHVEALIFASDRPLSHLDIADMVNQIVENEEILGEKISVCLEAIAEKYAADYYPFHLVQTAGGYQFLTKKVYHQTVMQLNGDKYIKKLSSAAMETLAIIAYKQPITKSEIEYIRGVSADYSMQKLLEKELIVITGRKEELPGKPLVYGTSKNFMDYLGLRGPEDLPQIKDLNANDIIIPTEGKEAITEDVQVVVMENGELLEERKTA